MKNRVKEFVVDFLLFLMIILIIVVLWNLATLPEFDSVIDKLLAQQEAMHRLSNLLMASILNGEHYELEVIEFLNKGELK